MFITYRHLVCTITAYILEVYITRTYRDYRVLPYQHLLLVLNIDSRLSGKVTIQVTYCTRSAFTGKLLFSRSVHTVLRYSFTPGSCKLLWYVYIHYVSTYYNYTSSGRGMLCLPHILCIKLHVCVSLLYGGYTS